MLPHLPAAWLSRPADVRAHLRAAAHRHGMVELALGPLILPAVFPVEGVQTEGFSVLLIRPAPPGSHAAPGQPVQVHYGDALAQCSFLTELRRVPSTGPWELALPKAIERRERRAVSRIPVRGMGPTLTVTRAAGSGPPTPWQETELIDLSVMGLAFSGPRQGSMGDRFMGRLGLAPGAAPLTPSLTLRALRPDPTHPGHWIHGCHMTGLAPSAYDRIGRALARLRNAA